MPTGAIKKIIRALSNDSINELPEDLDLIKQKYLDLKARNLALEDEIERMKLSPSNIQPSAPTTEQINTGNENRQIPPQHANPTTTNLNNNRVNNDLDKHIKNLLAEIRDYDGTQTPEAFKRSTRFAIKQLNNVEKDMATFTRRLVAQKIKGKAIPVVDRVDNNNLADIIHALETAFGQLELNYEQLAEQRNALRQGMTESVKNYITRYEEVHLRLQKALDSEPSEYRESLRLMEAKLHIKKFIRSLRPEIELRLLNDRPKTLRAAFAEAQLIEKQLRDDEILRSRRIPIQKNNQYPPRQPAPPQRPTPFPNPKPQHFNPPSPHIRFNNPGTKTFYCNHCKSNTHTEDRCFILHPELKKNFTTRQHTAETPPEGMDQFESEPHYTFEASEEIAHQELNY